MAALVNHPLSKVREETGSLVYSVFGGQNFPLINLSDHPSMVPVGLLKMANERDKITILRDLW